MNDRTRNSQLSGYIFATWRNWLISIGLLLMVVLLSPIVSRNIMPLIAIGAAGFLAIYIYRRHNRRNQGLAVPYIMALTLFVAAALMTIMNLTVKITDVYEIAGKTVNDELPFIVQLMLSPILSVCSGVFLLRRLGRRKYFRTHTGRSDVSIMQRLVWQESRYQVRLLFTFSTILAVVEWGYCYFYFITANLNHPDRFFFVWLPVIVYVLSVIYLSFHCASLHALYSQSDMARLVNPSKHTILRYLIVNQDNILLSKKHIKVKQGEAVYFDTPVRAQRPFQTDFSDIEACNIFKENSGITGETIIRFLFQGFGLTNDNNIRHYLCYLPLRTEVDDSRISDGRWCTMESVRQLDRMHLLSAELSSELVHIYTVGQAWKRYDSSGNRLYSIKQYNPTFNLSEIKDWTVDFNDPVWLKVARLNADKPFFRLRRFFSRITSPSVQ